LNEDLATASTHKNLNDYANNDANIGTCFDDFLLNSSTGSSNKHCNSSPEAIIDSNKGDSTGKHLYSTKDLTSINHNTINFVYDNNQNERYTSNEVDFSNISMQVTNESKPQEPPQHIGTRKRINNYKKFSGS
jgi:hypothetical protein